MDFNSDNQSMPFPRSTEQTFIQRVYQWMAAGLSLTGFVAYWAAGTESVMKLMLGPGFIVAMLVELGIVIWLSASIRKISAQAAITGFLIYSAINGLTMSYVFLIYTGASIAYTFFITAASFAAVSFFGWVTKTDLTSLGGFFLMGIIGLIIGSVVNMFLQAPVLYWFLTYAGVALFIGLTAYDVQKLKRMHQSGAEIGDQLAIFGALQLYLDFVNMFIYLLRIFGKRR